MERRKRGDIAKELCKLPVTVKCLLQVKRSENEDKKSLAELLYVFCVSHRAVVSVSH